MADENDFRPRPGRIRSSRSQRAKPFIAQALAAAQRPAAASLDPGAEAPATAPPSAVAASPAFTRTAC